MSILVVLCRLLLLYYFGGAEGSLRCRWEAFKRDHKKYYLSEAEEELRFSIFQNNIQDLQRQPKNGLHRNGHVRYARQTGQNMLSLNLNPDGTLLYGGSTGEPCPTASEPRWKERKGRTLEERARFAFEDALKAHNMTKSGSGRRSSNLLLRTLESSSSLKSAVALGVNAATLAQGEKKPPPPDPGHLDLRNCFMIARVQDGCGACYAFAAVATLECALYRKTGQYIALSEQMVIDCTKPFTFGCRGGLAYMVFDWVIKNKGISRAMGYFYTASDKGTCKFKREESEVASMTYKRVKRFSEDDLKAAVDKYGAVAVAIEARGNFGRFSGKGVYIDEKCSPRNYNHAMVVCGYGTLDGVDYWLARNSFGYRWGDNGYIKLARNKSNMCGVATLAVYVTSINEGF